MSAPYCIVDFFHNRLAQCPPDADIQVAIKACLYWRELGFNAHILGDNIDEGCSDGLNQDEREQVEEALS